MFWVDGTISIQYLLDHGAQVATRDKDGKTPLDYITESGLAGSERHTITAMLEEAALKQASLPIRSREVTQPQFIPLEPEIDDAP